MLNPLKIFRRKSNTVSHTVSDTSSSLIFVPVGYSFEGHDGPVTLVKEAGGEWRVLPEGMVFDGHYPGVTSENASLIEPGKVFILPSDQKGEFLPDMTEAEVLDYERKERLGWKAFKLPWQKDEPSK